MSFGNDFANGVIEVNALGIGHTNQVEQNVSHLAFDVIGGLRGLLNFVAVLVVQGSAELTDFFNQPGELRPNTLIRFLVDLQEVVDLLLIVR